MAVLLETWRTDNIQLQGFKYNFVNPAVHDGMDEFGRGRNSGGTLVSSNSLIYKATISPEYFQFSKWFNNGILFVSL